MSKSYHVTRKKLRGKTKDEIDEMFDDHELDLDELEDKKMAKNAMKKVRRNTKYKKGQRSENDEEAEDAK